MCSIIIFVKSAYPTLRKLAFSLCAVTLRGVKSFGDGVKVDEENRWFLIDASYGRGNKAARASSSVG